MPQRHLLFALIFILIVAIGLGHDSPWSILTGLCSALAGACWGFIQGVEWHKWLDRELRGKW